MNPPDAGPENSPASLSRSIPSLLASWAQRTPDAVALLAPGRGALTYSRLFERVRSICDLLIEMGVGREDRIGIVLPNGPEMAVSFLAVSSCAVSAPLNPAYGAREFEFYLSDLRAGVLILPASCDSPAAKVAAAHRIPVLEVAPHVDGPAGSFTLSHRSLGRAGTSGFSDKEDVALVLHTSGTTSRPKMVPLTHQNLCASACNIARWFELTEFDRCLSIMPLFHVHGLIGAVLSSLSAGASVVCTPGFHTSKFFEWMAEFHPTWYTAVPTMHQAILARADQHKEVVANHRLRLVRSCSSALAPRLMEQLEATFGVPTLESYGMTEASHQIASNPLPPRKYKAGSVGLAAGPEVATMDPEGNLLPNGQTGEIVLRGETITRGYEADPDANQRAFTNGWFRTGDAGHFDGEGYLFISSRIKEIINRGGEKISPREIDEVLLQHPAVAQAVAFSVAHAQLGEDVGAAVVLTPGAEASEAELRQFTATRLAYFKTPRIIRIVGEIPKGATGKIQRIGLAEQLGLAPIDDVGVPKSEYRKPRTPLEQELARIWREVLAVADIGIHDNFFALGGDSILTTTLIVRLKREIGAELALVEFVETPTIAGVAERIEAHKCKSETTGGSPLLVAIQPQGESPPLFCAPGLNGNLLGLCNLSRCLGPDQPIFAFATTGIAGWNKVLSIGEIASTCSQVMRARQPHGPYFLLGICFGGFIAYELARQLSCDGEDVALVGLLDCFNHAWRRNQPRSSLFAYKIRHAFTRLRFHAVNIARLRGRQRRDYLLPRFARFRREARDRILQHVYDTYVRRGRPIPRIVRDVHYAHRKAERTYERRPYAGTVALFRTTDPSAAVYPAPLMGWDGLLRGHVDVYEVPGDHLRLLFEPAVDTVAQALKTLLQAAPRSAR